MFRSVSPTIFESDEGFRVETRGPNQIIYSRQGHVLKVEGELMAKPSGFSIYEWSIKNWEAPFEQEIIDDPTRQRIISDIGRALEFAGYRWEVSAAPSLEEFRRRFPGDSFPKGMTFTEELRPKKKPAE